MTSFGNDLDDSDREGHDEDEDAEARDEPGALAHPTARSEQGRGDHDRDPRQHWPRPV